MERNKKNPAEKQERGKPKSSDRDASLDEALDQSFPTSDPPAQTNPVRGTRRNISKS